MKITICFRLVLVLVLIITLGGKPVYAQNTQDWSITGNAGTDPVTNFLGTTDNQPLEIRVNNERVLRLEPQANSPNLIGGIQENTVTPGVEGATIGGGGRRQGEFDLDPNRVTGDFGTVAGGQGNRAGDDKGNFGLVGATVSGGSQNTANGNHATVGGGSGNVALGPQSTVGGGFNNVAGTNPIPSDDDLGGGWSTISGGLRNVAADEYASVGGGEYNCALAQYATIAGGGRSNSDRSSSNRVTDNYGTVGGGGNNQAGNGTLNPDAPDWCLGRNSGISTDSIYATVSGGRDNTASGLGNTVGGGISNTASGIEATVSGGRDNTASENDATASGGIGNNASGILSTIAGGSFSNASAFDATVGGGTSNTANGTFTTIGGGIGNTASGVLSTIAGGAVNTARGDRATVSGGTNHNASGTDATVGGGIGNNVSGIEATVSGGRDNRASGTDATVSGGAINIVSGQFATIPGGTRNTAAGSFSFAAGHRANANNPGSFVWGDSTDRAIGSNRNNQFTARASGGVRFFSNSGATVGVQLAPGAGSWSSLSSQNAKTNFAPVDGQSILSRPVSP